MPVLIREPLEADPATYEVHYKSARGAITTADKELADCNDAEIERQFRSIERDFKKKGLLELKKTHRVIKLWWELGRRLVFLERMDVGDERDRIWLWRACYDHCGKLNPSRDGKLSVRARQRLKNSHFRYAALLGRLDWETVEAIGLWDSWSGICDSECFQNDERFVDWLKERAQRAGSPVARLLKARKHQDLFRELAKRIRHRFKKMDTSVLSRDELFDALDKVAYDALKANRTNNRRKEQNDETILHLSERAS
jgi:hypothetical protein